MAMADSHNSENKEDVMVINYDGTQSAQKQDSESFSPYATDSIKNNTESYEAARKIIEILKTIRRYSDQELVSLGEFKKQLAVIFIPAIVIFIVEFSLFLYAISELYADGLYYFFERYPNIIVLAVIVLMVLGPIVHCFISGYEMLEKPIETLLFKIIGAKSYKRYWKKHYGADADSDEADEILYNVFSYDVNDIYNDDFIDDNFYEDLDDYEIVEFSKSEDSSVEDSMADGKNSKEGPLSRFLKIMLKDLDEDLGEDSEDLENSENLEDSDSVSGSNLVGDFDVEPVFGDKKSTSDYYKGLAEYLESKRISQENREAERMCGDSHKVINDDTNVCSVYGLGAGSMLFRIAQCFLPMAMIMMNNIVLSLHLMEAVDYYGAEQAHLLRIICTVSTMSFIYPVVGYVLSYYSICGSGKLKIRYSTINAWLWNIPSLVILACAWAFTWTMVNSNLSIMFIETITYLFTVFFVLINTAAFIVIRFRDKSRSIK